MIFDTNVLIYLSKYRLNPERLFTEKSAISVITKIEALGFSFQDMEENNLLSTICKELRTIPLSDVIVEQTIIIRQKYRIKLPDAIIYTTALIARLPLLTNNIKDFISIKEDVMLVNPFDL